MTDSRLRQGKNRDEPRVWEGKVDMLKDADASLESSNTKVRQFLINELINSVIPIQSLKSHECMLVKMS
jgi:hypothetical protein